MRADPQVSVVIPTIGRATLRRAVLSALEQPLPEGDLEVIVVNDSGRPLDSAVGLPDDPRITVVTTNRRRQRAARNVGAAVARGHYLLFLDDDDWLLAEGLTCLLRAAQARPDAVAAYGGVQLVDQSGRVLASVNLGVSGNCACQMLGGAHITNSAMLIKTSAFWAVGGMNVTVSAADDVDLLRRLSLWGDFVNVPEAVVNVLRGEGWQTTVDYARHAVESLRASREHMLSQPGVFRRVVASANTPYWWARVVKAYAASVYWNLKHRRLWTAVSRAFYLLMAAALAVPSTVHADFWRGLADTQVPATFQRALEAAQQ